MGGHGHGRYRPFQDSALPERQLPAQEDAALAILREVFGFGCFRTYQREVIDQVIAGGDALVLMPTGGGKSLCYQIPALARAGAGIVAPAVPRRAR